MEHLNYSRQLASHCQLCKKTPFAENILYLHGASTKFLLPNGGRLFDDKEFKALDEKEILRLPYPCIALEYTCGGDIRPGGICTINGVEKYEDETFVDAPKRVVYAREIDNGIVVTVCFWVRGDGLWRVLPEIALPNVGYLDRTRIDDGRVTMLFFGKQMAGLVMSDYADELGALLCFLNVLQCSNIHVETSHARKSRKRAQAALAFDTYHLLTIDAPQGKNGRGSSTHRSPREHLRRGHIRRIADGRKIWVNATVVGAGRGAGVITKSYAVGDDAR